MRQQFAGLVGAAAWSDALRQFIADIKVHLGCTWAYCRSHPCGEDGKTFAPHANIIWNSSQKGGRIDPAQIARLWRAALSSAVDPVLHVSYINLTRHPGPQQLQHACAYIERCFPGWSWLGQWSRWYGQYPKELDQEKQAEADHHCAVCGSSFSFESPTEADHVSIAGLETLLDSGMPVHPAEAKAWALTLSPQQLPTAPPPTVERCPGLFPGNFPTFTPQSGE
jgi:hypothetical protein